MKLVREIIFDGKVYYDVTNRVTEGFIQKEFDNLDYAERNGLLTYTHKRDIKRHIIYFTINYCIEGGRWEIKHAGLC